MAVSLLLEETWRRGTLYALSSEVNIVLEEISRMSGIVDFRTKDLGNGKGGGMGGRVDFG